MSRKEKVVKIISKGTLIFLVVILAIAGYGQKKIRTLNGTQYPHANQPVTIVDREIEGESIKDDGTIVAGSDWVKNLKLTVKNTSTKRIGFFQIDLVVPKNDRHASRVVFPVRFGSVFFVSGRDNLKAELDRKRTFLEPGETAVVSVNEQEYKVFNLALKKTGSDDFDALAVQVFEVQFEDDTGWTLGYEWRRDPEDREKHIPLNTASQDR